MTTYKVGYFVGSLSSTSINRELSQVLIRDPQDRGRWQPAHLVQPAIVPFTVTGRG